MRCSLVENSVLPSHLVDSGAELTNCLQVHIHLHYAKWVLHPSMVQCFYLKWFCSPDATFLCTEVYLHKIKGRGTQQGTDFVRFLNYACPWCVSQCVSVPRNMAVAGHTGGLESLGTVPRRTQRQKPQPQRAFIQKGGAGSQVCPIPFYKSHLPAPGRSATAPQALLVFKVRENTFPDGASAINLLWLWYRGPRTSRPQLCLNRRQF